MYPNPIDFRPIGSRLAIASTWRATNERQSPIMGILEVMAGLVKSSTVEANAIVEEVQKTRVNVGKVVHEIRKDEATTDAKVKAFQTWLEKASKAINDRTAEVDAYIKSDLVSASSMSDEDFEAKKESFKLLKSNIRDAMRLAKSQPGYADTLFTDVPALLSLSTGKETNTGSGATGTRRPRLVSISVNGTDLFTEKDGKRIATFSQAAAFMSKDSSVKVTASDLSGAAYATVGSDNLADQTSVSFTHTVTDKDSKTWSYSVVAIPSQTAEVEKPATK
jgi:hypothetical protein